MVRFGLICMFTLLLICGVVAQTQDCTININGDLPEPQPLYIWPNTEEFVYPTSTDGISRIAAGEYIDFFCSTGFNTTGLDLNLITAQCVSDKTYSYKGQQFVLSDFVCKSYPYHVARGTAGACYEGASWVQIGFEVSPTRFMRVMDVCFDERLERTHYVKYEMTKANVGYQSGFPRPPFIEGGFFPGRDMNTVYSQVSQRAKISEILGSTELGAQLVQANTDFYMARGHLAAKADFIYGSQHRATFHFINAAPQWQIFNGYNWERVESSVRKLVGDYNMTLDVYTGTYGTLTLNNTSNVPKEIHLSVDVNNNPVVPVPKFYYRIIIDRATNRGVALIGVNNPYVTMEDIEREYILCDDVYDQMEVDWVSWNRTLLHNGYGYACDVNQFAAVVKHLPDLQVDGLLFNDAVAVAWSGALLLVCLVSRLLVL